MSESDNDSCKFRSENAVTGYATDGIQSSGLTRGGKIVVDGGKKSVVSSQRSASIILTCVSVGWILMPSTLQ